MKNLLKIAKNKFNKDSHIISFCLLMILFNALFFDHYLSKDESPTMVENQTEVSFLKESSSAELVLVKSPEDLNNKALKSK